MYEHNYGSLTLNFNDLMNDKIDIESQFKSKLKQYCLSRFYYTFVKNHNIACINDIALVDKNKLITIENDIFSFGKNQLKRKHFQMFIRNVTCHEDYKTDNKIALISKNKNNEKKKDENEKKEFDNISQFNMSTAVSPALTATTAFTTQFASNISMNESTIDDGDSILLHTGSVAYVNSIHDTMSTIDTYALSNYNSNNNGSSNQPQYSGSFQQSQSGSSIANTHTTHDTITNKATTYYNSNNIGSSNQAQFFESYQELQSQSQSQSMGTKYQAPLPSVGTSVVTTNDSVLMNNFTNTSNDSGSVSSFNA